MQDFVIRVKNAALARRKEVILPYSKINKAVGGILVKAGFLETLKEEGKGKKVLVAKIRYQKSKPVLIDVCLISKPSLRIYANAKHVKMGKDMSRGIEIISTSQGVMTGGEAKKLGIGGEVLFRIW